VSKKRLVVLSSSGYRGEDLIRRQEALTEVGYELVYVTPKRGKPQPLPPSMDASYFDPPLALLLASGEVTKNVRNFDNYDQLNNTINLSERFFERPFYSADPLVREPERCRNKRDAASVDLDQYEVACLAIARGTESWDSNIQSQHVTQRCLEYDCKDGTGFPQRDVNMGTRLYPLEYILRDATAPDGAYKGNFR
jgi:hypothetical protein